MDRTWLILDCNYLCFRCMLQMSGLSHDQKPVGVIYGFLRQVQSLANKFQNPKFLFAWDSERSYRREIYPEYKRKPKSKDDTSLIELLQISKPQFRTIRCSVLPRLGFKNSFLQTGIEADDIIAKLIQTYWDKVGSKIVIVSADNDLCQFLQPEVVMYDPKTKATYTEDIFVKEKKIHPTAWAQVKSIAGCSSDNVKGVSGVGELTAIKFLKGELKGRKQKEIQDFITSGLYGRNYHLIRLPYISTKTFILEEDQFSIKEFESLCLDYGFHSFLGKEAYNKWRKILE